MAMMKNSSIILLRHTSSDHSICTYLIQKRNFPQVMFNVRKEFLLLLITKIRGRMSEARKLAISAYQGVILIEKRY